VIFLPIPQLVCLRALVGRGLSEARDRARRETRPARGSTTTAAWRAARLWGLPSKHWKTALFSLSLAELGAGARTAAPDELAGEPRIFLGVDRELLAGVQRGEGGRKPGSADDATSTYRLLQWARARAHRSALLLCPRRERAGGLAAR